MKIDFVSDVACPWCAVGLWSLDRALERLGDAVDVELRFQPFELNPAMPAEGEDTAEYIARKYGASADQVAKNRAVIRERGAEVGFTFGDRPRIWNTFDAHRLLHWAGLQPGEAQSKLKHAPQDHRRARRRVQARDVADRLGVDAADRRHRLGAVVGDVGAQLLVADRAAGDERRVDEVFLDDDVHHRVEQGDVGVGLELQVAMRMIRFIEVTTSASAGR